MNNESNTNIFDFLLILLALFSVMFGLIMMLNIANSNIFTSLLYGVLALDGFVILYLTFEYRSRPNG